MPSSNLYIQVTKLKSATWDTKLEMIKSRVSALVHRLGHTDGPNLANNRTTVSVLCICCSTSRQEPGEM